MRIPKVEATIERRVLVNYRVDLDVLAAVLPPPFRPKVVADYGMAGICLIRLGDIRPGGTPAAIGLTTENVAHRVAVEWDTPDGAMAGVYIPRRDTASRLVAAFGGRIFPGWHHLADFDVDERAGRYRVAARSRDGEMNVVVAVRQAHAVPSDSVLGSLEEASSFFRHAPVGYSATRRGVECDGIQLSTTEWHIEPLEVENVRSSYFEDPNRFPPGTADLDSAFLMRGMATTWEPQARLAVERFEPEREKVESQGSSLRPAPSSWTSVTPSGLRP